DNAGARGAGPLRADGGNGGGDLVEEGEHGRGVRGSEKAEGRRDSRWLFGWLEVVDLNKAARAIFALKGGACGGVEEGNDLWVVVGDCVYVVDVRVRWLIHILLGLDPSGEPPAAVYVVSGPFAVHESNDSAVNSNHVSCNATTAAFSRVARSGRLRSSS